MHKDICPNCGRVELVTTGEDTGGFCYWCQRCGAMVDSGGNVNVPTHKFATIKIFKTREGLGGVRA